MFWTLSLELLFEKQAWIWTSGDSHQMFNWEKDNVKLVRYLEFSREACINIERSILSSEETSNLNPFLERILQYSLQE